MTDPVGVTPLTERYADTTLWRLLVRLSSMIQMSRHDPPQPAQSLLLDALAAPGLPMSDQERTWAGFTVLGQVLSASSLELTDEELLFVAITKLRQIMLTGQPDGEGDTAGGSIFALTLTVGIMATRVFGEQAEEILSLREVAGKAIKAKDGRAANARRINSEKTGWHDPALAKARELRVKYPHRSDEKIAELVYGDRSVMAPSHTETVKMVRQWRKVGHLPARQKATR